ncbi:hypothetical protein PUR34_08980 [Streptomyces sp. JV185]|uniref:hypothetical protein n=1 Tax=Streptomyces sp. JV185 TaxID=858638 RepID=UPI002E77C79B|nr:hypothetical protein [Streptomyces sp. JV185]MEE1768304.1 hypothetical protein [Streptomyces sp. JV185]
MTEATLALATITARWSLEHLPGQQQVRPVLGASFGPGKLLMQATPRQKPRSAAQHEWWGRIDNGPRRAGDNVTSTPMPLEVEACSRTCALACGCHWDAVSSTWASWEASCRFVSFLAR